VKYHVRGPIKSYNKYCFDQIGGLKPVLGWDGLDEFTAMSLGWKIKRLDELVVIHHRVTGTETNQIYYSIKIGSFCYNFGYDPLLTILKDVSRGIRVKPYLITGFYVIYSYIKCVIHNEEKYVEPEIRKFVRKFQYGRIFNLHKHF